MKPEERINAADSNSISNAESGHFVVFGIGSAGAARANMLCESRAHGATVIAMETDKVRLDHGEADKKILLGLNLTRGIGAGGRPEVGKAAAEENVNEIKDALKGAGVVFITAGLGGGTGTGASQVVARLAKEQGAIVIGVVTMPFRMEHARVSKANQGLYDLRQVTDTAIVIDHDGLVEVAGKLPIGQAFAVADELVAATIKGIVEMMAVPNTVMDYADVKAVMTNGGVAVVGVGESSSENRAETAVRTAMSNPLLDVSFDGASGALLHIVGGSDMTIKEANQIGELISKDLGQSAQVIWGARIDPAMEDGIRVMAIITGIKGYDELCGNPLF